MSTETLRKMGLFGIGLIAITQEKFEEFAQEMIKKGEVRKKEGKECVIGTLIEKDIQLREFGNKINQKIKDTIEKSGVATKQDLQAIEKRLELIQKNINIGEKPPEYVMHEI